MALEFGVPLVSARGGSLLATGFQIALNGFFNVPSCSGSGASFKLSGSLLVRITVSFWGGGVNSAKQSALPWLSPEELAQVKTVSCIEQALVMWPRVLSQYPLGK